MLLGLVCEIRAHKKCVIVLKAPITGLHVAVDVLVAQLKLQQIERVCLCLVSLARSKFVFLEVTFSVIK